MNIIVINKTDNTELSYNSIEDAITQIKRELRWNQTVLESNTGVEVKEITIKIE